MRMFTALSLMAALALAPFASSEPDGLERVADRHGFVDRVLAPGGAGCRLRGARCRGGTSHDGRGWCPRHARGLRSGLLRRHDVAPPRASSFRRGDGLSGAAHVLWMPAAAGAATSAVHRLDPRAKLVGLLGVTLAAATAPPGQWIVLPVFAAILFVVAAVARVPLPVVWRHLLGDASVTSARGRLVAVRHAWVARRPRSDRSPCTRRGSLPSRWRSVRPLSERPRRRCLRQPPRSRCCCRD